MSGHMVNVRTGRHSYRLLDLFCGEGLAAWGYWKSARFSEIVGVDMSDMNGRYAFDFIQRDALSLDYDFLSQFDFIHASPPCQAYSKLTPDPSKHPRLIASTHLMLQAAGKPYVIENVEGSSQELRPNLVINGQYVGLPIDRKRYFHVSTLPSPLRLLRKSPATNVLIHSGDFLPKSDIEDAMGLDIIPERKRRVLTREGIEEGIPPAFSKFIAELLLPKFYMSSVVDVNGGAL